ncbi:hypothetical protein ACJJID_10960 [Microbulbifer sp. CnH-101-G]|uniref:hypothetical protein n=1 Tax=Microbulbifer sp. CnH-101-G TaxID=3243393 RepID=UPI004039FDBF
MLTLFIVLVVSQGKTTFMNIEFASERRNRLWSHRNFDFVKFNAEVFMQTFPSDNKYIAAIDACYINKSGKKTEDLGWYYNGSGGASQRGLAISIISITDLKSNTAYAMDAQQTIDEEGRSRIELYAHHTVKLVSTPLDLGIK